MHLLNFLQTHPDIEFIHYQWLDLGNILRTEVLTKQYALSHSDKPMKATGLGLDLLPLDDFAPSFTGMQSNMHMPDWSSLRVCRYMDEETTHASVMCFVDEGKYDERRVRCPRTILQKSIRDAKEKDGFQFLLGVEVEFFLYEKAGKGVTPCLVDNVLNYSSDAGIRDERIIKVLSDMVRCLTKRGIEVERYHTEQGHGHFEISTGPLPPLEAVDALVYSQRVIWTVASRHGFLASTFPKCASGGSCTNGLHCHFSINDAQPESSEHFLAGILTRLPALSAFGMASVDSHTRLGDMRGTMGSRVAWGTEQKDLVVRKIQNRTGYWEIRCVDATANLYLTIAAFITAGCRGVREEQPLLWKDPPGILAFMSEAEIAACNIDTYLPLSLLASVEALKKCIKEKELEPMSELFLNTYATQKEIEHNKYSEMPEEERVLAMIHLL